MPFGIREGQRGELLTLAQLNGLASKLADGRFSKSPKIHNELLNRVRPSSNAIAAQNLLLRRMALHEGEPRLGIEGFPAEGGLFDSLLEKSGIYRNTRQGWRFESPTAIAPTIRATLHRRGKWQSSSWSPTGTGRCRYPRYVRNGRSNPLVSKTVCCPFWRRHSSCPSGVMSRSTGRVFSRPGSRTWTWITWPGTSAMYSFGGWTSQKRPGSCSLTWLALFGLLDEDNTLPDLEPIDVAKGLVSIHDRLPPWVGRTQHLSSNAKRVRQLFKQASDPNSLIFDDIPRLFSDGLNASNKAVLGTIANNVHEGLVELQEAYPSMLHRLRETLLSELQVPNASGPMLAELRARAENVRELSGDHRMEAFIMRLAQFFGTDADMESMTSMVANKPARTWVDADIDRTAVELADTAQKFMRLESFAHVKGRFDNRHSMAVTVGMGGQPTTVHDEFEVTFCGTT